MVQADVRCFKVRYFTRKEAKRAAKLMTRKMKTRYRSYTCQWCNLYHITHEEKRGM